MSAGDRLGVAASSGLTPPRLARPRARGESPAGRRRLFGFAVAVLGCHRWTHHPFRVRSGGATALSRAPRHRWPVTARSCRINRPSRALRARSRHHRPRSSDPTRDAAHAGRASGRLRSGASLEVSSPSALAGRVARYSRGAAGLPGRPASAFAPGRPRTVTRTSTGRSPLRFSALVSECDVGVLAVADDFRGRTFRTGSTARTGRWVGGLLSVAPSSAVIRTGAIRWNRNRRASPMTRPLQAPPLRIRRPAGSCTDAPLRAVFRYPMPGPIARPGRNELVLPSLAPTALLGFKRPSQV